MEEAEFDELYAASYARLVGQLQAMIGDRDEAQADARSLRTLVERLS